MEGPKRLREIASQRLYQGSCRDVGETFTLCDLWSVMNRVCTYFRTVKMTPLPISGSLVNSELHNVWNTAYVKRTGRRGIPRDGAIHVHLFFNNQHP